MKTLDAQFILNTGPCNMFRQSKWPESLCASCTKCSYRQGFGAGTYADCERWMVALGAGTEKGSEGPPAHLEEPTCPCCIPTLGEFGEVPPRGGPREVYGRSGPGRNRAVAPGPRFVLHRPARVACPTEDSHSGLVRTIGNRVGDETPQGFKSPILRQRRIHAAHGQPSRCGCVACFVSGITASVYAARRSCASGDTRCRPHANEWVRRCVR